MKKAILACTCALLLSTGGVFAQTQPAPGGAAHSEVGPGAGKSATKHSNMKKGTTTGMSSGKMKAGSKASAPSSSGDVGPGTDSKSGPQPGGR